MKPLLIFALAYAAQAQDVMKMIDWDALGAKARESVNVNLDANMVGLAKKFMGMKDAAKAAQLDGLLSKVRSIQVRVLEFDNEGEYKMADVDAARSKLAGPGWSSVVEVKERKERVSVLLKMGANKQIDGIVVIAAEPKELTMVHIDGEVGPDALAMLGGQFGIPNMHLGPAAAKAGTKPPAPPKPPAPAKDEE